MPKPTDRPARSRPDIADSLTEFDLEANNNKMICTQLLPVFETNAQAGNYGRIPIEALLEESDTSRASGASYGRGDYEFEEAFFATKENGWEEPVDERDSNIYSDYFDAELIATQRARAKVLINQEKRAKKNTFDNPNINSGAVGTPWDDANGDPISDVEDAVIDIWKRTGIWPNCMVMSYLLFRKTRNNPKILDRISANGAGDRIRATDVTVEQLKEVFDLEHILVAGASRNVAKKGQAVDVAQIWDPTKAMVCRRIESQDIREPGLGRTFHWSQDGSSIGGRVESYWWEPNRSDIYRVRHETDERIAYPECAEVMTGVAAAP